MACLCVDLIIGGCALNPQPRCASSSTPSDASGDEHKQISGPPLSEEWFAHLSNYWTKHQYFPPQSIARCEGGVALIRITVNNLGRVTDVSLQRSTGSLSLDAAAQSWIRNAQLEPLPAAATDDKAVIDIRITYLVLSKRR
jgi:TonB family protein